MNFSTKFHIMLFCVHEFYINKSTWFELISNIFLRFAVLFNVLKNFLCVTRDIGYIHIPCFSIFYCIRLKGHGGDHKYGFQWITMLRIDVLSKVVHKLTCA